MASMACIGNPNGAIVKADKLTLKETEQCFYCSTTGCDARMMLVSRMTEHAHFRSYHIRDHKFDQCIVKSLSFDSSKYSEKSFNLNDAIKHIVGSDNPLNIHKRNNSVLYHSSTKHSTIGGTQDMPIHTLKELYAQCLDTGIKGTYAGICINDILACRHNFNIYRNGFEGFKIVEVTYYKKVYNEPALLFNYPYYDRGKINLYVSILKTAKKFGIITINLKIQTIVNL